MDKINLLVKTLLIAALSVPIVAVTVISNSNSIANASQLRKQILRQINVILRYGTLCHYPGRQGS